MYFRFFKTELSLLKFEDGAEQEDFQKSEDWLGHI